MEDAATQQRPSRHEDDVEIVDGGGSDAFAIYYADEDREEGRPPTYNDELGLAVETLPEGLSISDLWRAVPEDEAV